MQVYLIKISKDFYHGVVDGETVYRVMKSPVWSNKWRAFTHPGGRFVADTDTLKQMQDHLSQEALI